MNPNFCSSVHQTTAALLRRNYLSQSTILSTATTPKDSETFQRVFLIMAISEVLLFADLAECQAEFDQRRSILYDIRLSDGPEKSLQVSYQKER